MEFESTEAYIKYLEDEKLINHDGSPRKCSCGCTEFKQVDKYKEEGYLVEYKLQCLECKSICGHWAYGHWQF